MSPEEKRQFEELKKQVKELSEPINVARIQRIMFRDDKNVTDSQVNIATVIGDSGGTVNHLDFPDRWLIIEHRKKSFLIPAYFYTRLDD